MFKAYAWLASWVNVEYPWRGSIVPRDSGVSELLGTPKGSSVQACLRVCDGRPFTVGVLLGGNSYGLQPTKRSTSQLVRLVI
jgi:hypothetical protein